MARKTIRHAALGSTLVLTQWGALEGAQNSLRVARLFGPSLAPFVDLIIAAAKGGESAASIESRLVDGIDVSKIVAGLQTAQGADLDGLIRSLEATTEVEQDSTVGRVKVGKLDADEFFAGEYAALFEWLAIGLLFNLAGFTPSAPKPQTSPSR